MKLGFDISMLPSGRGVSNYIINLLEEFSIRSPENEYKLLCNSAKPCHMPSFSPKSSLRTLKLPNRILKFFWHGLGFPPVEWILGDIDLFHSPAHTPVYAICPPAKKWVVTVHDLFTFKMNYKKNTQREEMKILQRMSRKASHVIAVSYSTKNDLLELIPSLESRVSVIHEGVGKQFRIIDNFNITLEKYGINRPYILYVGSAAANKNISTILSAFTDICSQVEHDFVMIGHSSWRYDSVKMMIKENKIKERVKLTGFISDEDLPAFYSGADLFVSPSLYEGFGLAFLEAMACGTPVIASNVASMPEVVGDAGVLIDPHDVGELSDAILRILKDDTLKKRLREKGLHRASAFSWESAAEKTLEIYEHVLRF